MSTIEELLEERVASQVQKSGNTAAGIRHANFVTPFYPQKLAISSPTSGGRPRAEATEFCFWVLAPELPLPVMALKNFHTSCFVYIGSRDTLPNAEQQIISVNSRASQHWPCPGKVPLTKITYYYGKANWWPVTEPLGGDHNDVINIAHAQSLSGAACHDITKWQIGFWAR
jgi:hypothetical protein